MDGYERRGSACQRLPANIRQFASISSLPWRHRFGPADNPIFVNDHRGAKGESFFLAVDPEIRCHPTFRMPVAEQRETDAAQGFGPVFVRMFAVDAHTQDLGVKFLEKRKIRFKVRNFLTSGTGPVQRIEHQHHVHVVLETNQGNFTGCPVQFEFRRDGSYFNHLGSLIVKGNQGFYSETLLSVGSR